MRQRQVQHPLTKIEGQAEQEEAQPGQRGGAPAAKAGWVCRRPEEGDRHDWRVAVGEAGEAEAGRQHAG